MLDPSKYDTVPLPIIEDPAERASARHRQTPAQEQPAEDPNDYLPPREARLVREALLDDDAVLLSGPTGCGKSSLIAHLARGEGVTLLRLNLSSGTREPDFLGHRAVTVDRKAGCAVTSWEDGSLLQAMTYQDPDTLRGAWLLLDEVDCALPEVLVTLDQVLESGHPRSLTVAEDGGRRVTAHADFRVAMTANTVGQGDEVGIYAGAGVLNAAFLDRLTIFRMTYPEREQELLGRHLPAEEAARLMRWAREVRQRIAGGDLITPLSTRVLLRTARKVRRWDLPTAIRVEVLNRLPADEEEVVREICHAVLDIEP